MASEIRIGTRGSQLALWQAHTVAASIAKAGGPPCRIVAIKTAGDRLQNVRLAEFGGKGLFVKEIEDALLRGEVDIAVHSSKDMPASLPDGLTIAGVLPREDPRDALVLSARHHPVGSRGAPRLSSIESIAATLGPAPHLATGSVRRIAQLSRLFRGARFAPIRGNLDTRLRKLDAGADAAAEPGSEPIAKPIAKYDALVLAAAGLRRLGFDSRISLLIPETLCLPAPGQGIVAIEVREDATVLRLVESIHDPAAGAALAAERAVVQSLSAGCQTPVAALATPVDDDRIEIEALVSSLDGERLVRARAAGSRLDASHLGAEVGAHLLAQGAGEILADIERYLSSGGVATTDETIEKTTDD